MFFFFYMLFEIFLSFHINNKFVTVCCFMNFFIIYLRLSRSKKKLTTQKMFFFLFFLIFFSPCFFLFYFRLRNKTAESILTVNKNFYAFVMLTLEVNLNVCMCVCVKSHYHTLFSHRLVFFLILSQLESKRKKIKYTRQKK